MTKTTTCIFIDTERKRRKQYYGTDRSYVTTKSEVLNMFDELARVADSLKLAASQSQITKRKEREKAII